LINVRPLFFLIFFSLLSFASDTGMHYFVNRVDYPMDIENADTSTLKNYNFIRLHISKKGIVSGYDEFYPYVAPYTRYSLAGNYDASSHLVKVVANGWLHKEYYYRDGKLYVEENDTKETIDEVSEKEFIQRYEIARKRLDSDKAALKMRRLKVGFFVEMDPMWGEMAFFPVGFKKVSSIEPSAGALWFLPRLLSAGGWKRGEATPQKVMARFHKFVSSDFNNTGRLDHIIDGLILLDNYLTRVDLSPFNGEHMEAIEKELLETEVKTIEE